MSESESVGLSPAPLIPRAIVSSISTISGSCSSNSSLSASAPKKNMCERSSGGRTLIKHFLSFGDRRPSFGSAFPTLRVVGGFGILERKDDQFIEEHQNHEDSPELAHRKDWYYVSHFITLPTKSRGWSSSFKWNFTSE